VRASDARVVERHGVSALIHRNFSIAVRSFSRLEVRRWDPRSEVGYASYLKRRDPEIGPVSR